MKLFLMHCDALVLVVLLLAEHRTTAETGQRPHGTARRNQNQSNARRPLKLPSRGGYTQSTAPPNVRQRLASLFSSDTSVAPKPTGWDKPSPVHYDGREGDWIDGDLFLPSHLPTQQSTDQIVEKLKQQVTRTAEEAEAEAAQQEAIRNAQIQQQQNAGLSRLDLALFATYFCNMIAVTLPVILMPLVAAEHVAGTASSAAAVVATIASISTLGGGLGKLLNGFVCQFIGGRRASSIYLVGLAAASLGLSVSSAGHAGWILAMVEFFASIQWTACSLVFANHYSEPAKFAKGISILAMASTSGQIVAKVGGTALLKSVSSWRTVAQLAGMAALVGALIVKTLVTEQPAGATRRAWVLPRNNNSKSQQNIGQSIKAVLGNPLFWQVGIAHATAMLARTSDRILGTFFHQTTSLSRSVCGGLTAFMTVGFVHGLVKGRKFHDLPDIRSKTQMISKAYAFSALTAVGMAICSNAWIQKLFPSKHVLAATIAALTGNLASNIAFQFYQIPAMAASTFGSNRALCLSLFDALGYFMAAPVWATTGKIVQCGGKHGWTLAWLMLAALFGAGGKTMMNAFPSVLVRQQQQQHRP